MHFVFMGSPGTGKGTCAQYLSQKKGYITIAPGDMFRDEITKQTALGRFIQPHYESGHYLDHHSNAETILNQVGCELVRNKITHDILQQDKQFIIDGFPRSEASFKSLHKFFEEHGLDENICFVEFLASDATCLKRIAQRRICPHCFMVHSDLLFEAKKCCNCAADLIVRKNDAPEFAHERIDFYHKTIEPLFQTMIKKLYRIEKIKTECSLETLQEKYEKLLFQNL